MIVVKIELWPRGFESQARELGRAVIANDGTGDVQYGNYDVALAHSGRYVGRKGAWKGARVEKHPRALSPYHLLRAALTAALTGIGKPSAKATELIEWAARGGSDSLLQKEAA